jgi:hypothetical protein
MGRTVHRQLLKKRTDTGPAAAAVSFPFWEMPRRLSWLALPWEREGIVDGNCTVTRERGGGRRCSAGCVLLISGERNWYSAHRGEKEKRQAQEIRYTMRWDTHKRETRKDVVRIWAALIFFPSATRCVRCQPSQPGRSWFRRPLSGILTGGGRTKSPGTICPSVRDATDMFIYILQAV